MSNGEDIHPPADLERLRGQQIITERVIERAVPAPNGNGGFAKFKDGALLLAMAGLVAAVWSQNTRLTRIETLLEVTLAAQGVEVKKGVEVQK